MGHFLTMERFQNTGLHMNRVKRKSTFYIGENNGADHCFRYIDSKIL